MAPAATRAPAWPSRETGGDCLEPLRLRVQFTKRGRARYLSHAEYYRTIMLGARRSGLPLLYTGKFRPRMKVSLSPPLPIGVTSECELVDIFLSDYVSPAEAARLFSESLPKGIEVVRCRLMKGGGKSVGKIIDTAAYRVVLPEKAGSKREWRRAVEVFLGKESVEFERVQPRRTRVVELRSGVHGLEVLEDEPAAGVRISMVVDDGTRGTVKPREVFEVLSGLAGAPPGLWEGAQVSREGLFARRGDRLVSPMELARGRPAV